MMSCHDMSRNLFFPSSSDSRKEIFEKPNELIAKGQQEFSILQQSIA